MGEKLTWRDRLTNLRMALGREPTLAEKLECASIHRMTPDEIEEQRLSFVRAFTARCEHGVLDFEQCPNCRGRAALAREEGR